MAKKNNETISTSVNGNETARPTKAEEQPMQTRAGLKLRTNIKAGGMAMIIGRLDDAEEV